MGWKNEDDDTNSDGIWRDAISRAPNVSRRSKVER